MEKVRKLGKYYPYPPYNIGSKDHRLQITEHYSLFPFWDTTIIDIDDESQIINHSCYIRWKDYEGVMRQELKTYQFSLNKKDSFDNIEFRKSINLQIFINDCYSSIFHNCEKYKNKKFLEWPESYQISEKEHYIEEYKSLKIIEDIATMTFDNDID